MAVYNGSKMAAGVTPRYLPSAAGVRVLSTFASAVALLLNDTINMMQLAANPVEAGNGPSVLGVTLDSDDLDTGAGLVYDVGDATVANRYISASNIGQAGGIARNNVAGSIGYQPFSAAFGAYPTPSNQLDTIVVKINTAPAAWQAGTIRLLVDFTYDP